MISRLATCRRILFAKKQATVALLLVTLVGLGPLLSGCRDAPRAVAAIGGEEQIPSSRQLAPVPPSPTTAGPPIVSSRDEGPASFPSFTAPRPEEIVMPSPSPPASLPYPSPEVEVDDGTPVGQTSAAEPTAAATELPPPTFTPPATPDESTDDHYWLQRPVAAGGVVWTDKHYPYGSTRGGELRPHHGVEFNVPYNTQILAAASGTVRVAGSDADEAYGAHTNFYGNLVIIEHDFQYAGQPVYTLYGHLNEVVVSAGQQVSAQQILGLSGATGVADGPHMHFEVRVGANSYSHTRNPLLWLYPFPERGTIAGRVVWPDGSPAEGAPVSLNRVDGSSPYYGTTTYSGNSVNGDERWQENFAIDDVVAGYYEVVVRIGEKKYTAETWVYSYRTSSVEITIE